MQTLENLQSPDTVRKPSVLVTAHYTHANNNKWTQTSLTILLSPRHAGALYLSSWVGSVLGWRAFRQHSQCLLSSMIHVQPLATLCPQLEHWEFNNHAIKSTKSAFVTDSFWTVQWGQILWAFKTVCSPLNVIYSLLFCIYGNSKGKRIGLQWRKHQSRGVIIYHYWR